MRGLFARRSHAAHTACSGRGELELRLVLRQRCPEESVEAASDLRIAGSLRGSLRQCARRRSVLREGGGTSQALDRVRHDRGSAIRVGQECGVGVSHSSGFLGACDKRRRRMRRGSGCQYCECYTPSREQIERNETWAAMIAHIISQYRTARLETQAAG